MDFKENESGLVVPKEKNKRPARSHGPLELMDEERRQMAKDGLTLLWDAMELSNPGGIRLDDRYKNYTALYDLVGELLIGQDDMPYREILC